MHSPSTPSPYSQDMFETEEIPLQQAELVHSDLVLKDNAAAIGGETQDDEEEEEESSPELASGQDQTHMGLEEEMLLQEPSQEPSQEPTPRQPQDLHRGESSEQDIDLLKSPEEDVDDDKRKQLTLIRRKELQIVEWLREQRLLYDKSHVDFKSREKKKRVLEEMAARLQIRVDDLKKWITTKRTQYGKLRKGKKSGSGSPNYTENDRFILKNFAFLDPFITRQRPTKTLGIEMVSYFINIFYLSFKHIVNEFKKFTSYV